MLRVLEHVKDTADRQPAICEFMLSFGDHRFAPDKLTVNVR